MDDDNAVVMQNKERERLTLVVTEALAREGWTFKESTKDEYSENVLQVKTAAPHDVFITIE